MLNLPHPSRLVACISMVQKVVIWFWQTENTIKGVKTLLIFFISYIFMENNLFKFQLNCYYFERKVNGKLSSNFLLVVSGMLSN